LSKAFNFFYNQKIFILLFIVLFINMIELQHKNFHKIDKLKPGEKKLYVLSKWKPKKDIWVTGAAIGLLCIKNEYCEIYLCISKSPKLEPKNYFIGLKRDFMFYQQRDVYAFSDGINDLIDYTFLPDRQGFFIKKGETIYVKVGAINLTKKPLVYDAFCNVYYFISKKQPEGTMPGWNICWLIMNIYSKRKLYI